MYRPNTTWTWAFLMVTIVQAAVVLALESYIFAEFQMSLVSGIPITPLVKVIPTYLSIFIFGYLYQLFLVYDSLRLKNTIQVIGLCIFNVAILIYAAVQPNQISKSMDKLFAATPVALLRRDFLWPSIQPSLIAIPSIIGLALLIMSFIAWKLYDEFAWTIYKHISADLRMKRRFLIFQIYIALLKFDFFFFLGFTVQFLVIVSSQNYDAEFYLTVAAIPITIIILSMAGFLTRREMRYGMVLTIILYFGGMAYFIFKLARMYQPTKSYLYEPARTSLTIFAVVTVILLVLTIINACVCMSNFDQGLKPFVLNRKIMGDHEKIEHPTELPDLKHGQTPSRMTID